MNGWIFWVVIGGVMVVGGVLALVNPLAATLTAEQIAAWVFLLAGVLQGVALFRSRGWLDRVWVLLLAVACVWLGVSLLANPLAGVLALTILVAAGFLASGIAKVVLAWRARGTGLFWPVLLSGLASVLLAAMVFLNLPQSAAVLLGVMLAIELLVSGATVVAFALTLRNAPSPA